MTLTLPDIRRAVLEDLLLAGSDMGYILCEDAKTIRVHECDEDGTLSEHPVATITITMARRPPEESVEVGQRWADNDARNEGERRCRILAIEGERAVAEWETTAEGTPIPPEERRTTRIKLSRFRPTSTGYRRLPDDLPKD